MQPTRRERILIETILVFLLFVVPAYLATPAAPTETIGLSPLLPGMILSAVPQVGLLLYLIAIQGEHGRPELGLRWPTGGETAAALLLLPLMLGTLALTQIALGALPREWAVVAARGARIRLSGWAELPVALVFAPLAAAREELLYRSYLFVRLQDLGLPWLAALVVTTLLFAAAHAYQGPLAVGLALVLGLLLGAAFIRTKTLVVPLVSHALYNIALLAAPLIPGLGEAL